MRSVDAENKQSANSNVVYALASQTLEAGDPGGSTEKISLGKLPKVYSLSYNYPNPFNPSTTIKYSLPEEGVVKLEVYNIVGEKVALLVEEPQEAGYYETIWRAQHDGVPSGTFFLRLTVTNEYGKQLYQESRKLLLVK